MSEKKADIGAYIAQVSAFFSAGIPLDKLNIETAYFNTGKKAEGISRFVQDMTYFKSNNSIDYIIRNTIIKSKMIWKVSAAGEIACE